MAENKNEMIAPKMVEVVYNCKRYCPESGQDGRCAESKECLMRWDICNELGCMTVKIDIVQLEGLGYVPKRELDILTLQLKLAQGREEKLCPDHRGKQLGSKTGCIACDMEYYLKTQRGYIKKEDAPKHCVIDGRKLDDILVWYAVDKELRNKRQLYADIIKTNPVTLKQGEK